jgi:hypothetical protein
MSDNLRDYFSENPSGKIKAYCDRLLKNSHIDLAKIIGLAHKLTLLDGELKSTNYKQRNYMTENMYGNMIGLLYDNYPDLMQIDKEARPYLKLASDARIYMKKLNEKYLPSNVVTQYVLKLRGQELFEDGSQIHVLYAGYLLKEEVWGNDLTGTFISYVNKYYPTRTEWILDLAEYKKDTTIALPFHIEEMEQRLVTAKKNLGQTGEQGM